MAERGMGRDSVGGWTASGARAHHRASGGSRAQQRRFDCAEGSSIGGDDGGMRQVAPKLARVLIRRASPVPVSNEAEPQCIPRRSTHE